MLCISFSSMGHVDTGYFLQSPESAKSRQQLLVDAFRIHRCLSGIWTLKQHFGRCLSSLENPDCSERYDSRGETYIPSVETKHNNAHTCHFYLSWLNLEIGHIFAFEDCCKPPRFVEGFTAHEVRLGFAVRVAAKVGAKGGRPGNQGTCECCGRRGSSTLKLSHVRSHRPAMLQFGKGTSLNLVSSHRPAMVQLGKRASLNLLNTLRSLFAILFRFLSRIHIDYRSVYRPNLFCSHILLHPSICQVVCQQNHVLRCLFNNHDPS